MNRLIIFALAMAFPLIADQNAPQFRTMTTRVSIDVSVMSGNVPVPDLATADFSLLDNRVPQTIEAVSLAAVPVDVSMVVDVSGSTAAQIKEYRRDVAAIATMLRPIDRLRLITFDSVVRDILPLGAVAGAIDVDEIQTGNLSAVHDGLAAALLRQSAPGRRHLIVGYTDGFDNRSLMTAEQLLELGSTSEAVMHLVTPRELPNGLQCAPATSSVRLPGLADLPECPRVPLLQQAVEATGGRVHRGAEIADPFKKIFRDFLNSYVLYFQPTGVGPTGWHDVSVKVTKPGRYTVHARRGYFASR